MELCVKKFTELSPEELYGILRSRSEVFVVEQDCVYQDLDGRDERSLHVFIKEGNDIIAYLRVIRPDEQRKEASIGRVLTKKEARGKGIARILMLKGIEIAKSMAPTIEIEAQSYLKNFYESLGFRVCSEEFIYELRRHIRMKM